MVQIQGDGNCLFRAFSYWATGSEAEHRKIRNILAAATGNRNMKKEVWGGIDDIMAAAKTFGVDVMVWARFGNTGQTWHKHRGKQPYTVLYFHFAVVLTA